MAALNFEKRLKLYLAGNVAIPVPHQTARLKVVGRKRGPELQISTSKKSSGQPKIHTRYTVLLRDVCAVFKAAKGAKKSWYWNDSKKCWYIGKKLKKRLKKLKKAARGIVYVREDAPVLVESNLCEPFAVLAGELDDVQEVYGPPGPCKC